MKNHVKTTLIVIAVLALAAILVAAGFIFSHRFNQGFGYSMVAGNRTWRNNNFVDDTCNAGVCSPGNTFQSYGRGMMGQFSDNSTRSGYGVGRGYGMMGGRYNYQTSDGQILSIEEARSAFESYLANLGNEDLEIHEIMVFDQNAYAVVVEESTGIGAMELLVDHNTQTVFPEYGPNHMWNTKYSMMGGRSFGFSGSFGRRMGWNSDSSNTTSVEMSIGMEEAAEIAEAYLTSNLNEAELAKEGYPFYGYYTFDYMQDGEMAGMLSVNGSNGQVWEHTWHGQFIEEWELEEHN